MPDSPSTSLKLGLRSNMPEKIAWARISVICSCTSAVRIGNCQSFLLTIGPL